MFLPKAEKTNEPNLIVFVLTNFNLTLTCVQSLYPLLLSHAHDVVVPQGFWIIRTSI
jgi:hypothetical protein